MIQNDNVTIRRKDVGYVCKCVLKRGSRRNGNCLKLMMLLFSVASSRVHVPCLAISTHSRC